MSSIVSITLLVASVAIFFGYVSPTYRTFTGEPELGKRSVTELKEERGRYEEALAKTKEIELERTGLLEKYNQIPLADRERIEKLLPDHIDSVRLIIDVNNIASQYGMTLKNISLLDEKEGSGTPIGPQEGHSMEVGLRFSVSGTYEKFRSFLKDLERSLRLVDVRTIGFSAEKVDYEYSVSLSTYKLTIPTDESF